jgi:hypothetical protein
VYDSVINFNGHISAISKALQQYKSQGKPSDAAAAAEPTTTTSD